MDSRTRSTAAHLVMNVSYATRPKTPSRNSWLHSNHKCGTSSDSCRKLHVCISRYLVSGSCRDAFLRALDLTTPTCFGKFFRNSNCIGQTHSNTSKYDEQIFMFPETTLNSNSLKQYSCVLQTISWDPRRYVLFIVSDTSWRLGDVPGIIWGTWPL